MSERVLIIGAGHQGIAMAAHFALNGVIVKMWNRTYKTIQLLATTKTIFCRGIVWGEANVAAVSTDIQDVLEKHIMITTPSIAHRDIAKMLAEYVTEEYTIILNPGRTFGALEFARILRESGCKSLPTIAEAQTIVYTCRKFSSDSVEIYALKNEVLIAAMGNEKEKTVMECVPKCIRKYFKFVDSMVYTSLGNVGMILHCLPVLMNVGWIESKNNEFKYYYEGITPTIANILEKLDNERVQVAKAMGKKVETISDWLKRTYQIKGENLYECIQANKCYEQIDAPSSLEHRYLEEDIPCGLVPLESAGKKYNIDVSVATLIIDFANLVMNKDYRITGRNINLLDGIEEI